MINFIFCFIFSCLAVIGWFAITRGRWEINEKGNLYVEGKIFKFWWAFWNKSVIEHGEKVVNWHRDAKFLESYSKISKEINFVGNIEKKVISENGLTYLQIDGYTLSDILEYKQSEIFNNKKTGIVVNFKELELDGRYLMIVNLGSYKKYFKEWLIDWLCNCPTCSASLYGSIAYLFFLCSGLLNFEIIKISSYFFYTCLWVTWTFSMAYINTILAKKMQ